MNKMRIDFQNRQPKPLQPLFYQRILIFALMVLLGAVLSSHVRTVHANYARSDLSVRYRQRQEDLRRYEEQYDKLMAENLELNRRKEEAIADLLQREGQEELLAELQIIHMLAGFTEVRGAGVRVVLNDKPNYDLFLDSADSIVHDGDIRLVLDLLRNAGAGAFTVNNQRLVNSSYIYCIGPTILCNQQRLTPPYIIEALGDPEALAAAVRNDPVLAIRRSAPIGLIVEVEAKEEVIMVPFAEASNIQPYIDRLEVVNR